MNFVAPNSSERRMPDAARPRSVNRVFAQRRNTRNIVLTCFRLSALFVVCLSLVVYESEAQTNIGNARISPEQAVTLTSHLTVGMKETAAIECLASNGFKAAGKLGCNHGCTCFF